MSRRSNPNGRSKTSRFAGIPHAVMDHSDYKRLSGNAIKLLLEFARQYNGQNNGDLSAAFSVLQKKGWRSKGTLCKSLNQLIRHDMIVKTREGRFQNPGHRCALFALAWQAIDECPNKDLEVPPTRRPYRSFAVEFSKSPCPKTAISSTSKMNPSRARDDTGRFLPTQKLDS